VSDLLALQFSTAAPPPHWWEIDWSAGIRRACHSPFSHVDMEMEDGNLLGASNSPDAPIVVTVPPGNPGGVALRPPDYQQFGYRRRMLLKTARAADIRAIWHSQLGKAFDHSALLDMISDKFPGARDWRLTDAWFCGDGIFWSMETGDFWNGPVPWPKNRVSPTDIIMFLLNDPRFVNRDTFWLPIPGLKLGSMES
jgi:hypothetical protein